jgi:hypothetical protein
MSWSFSVVGDGRKETFEALEVEAKRYDRPQPQVDQIVRWATALAEGMPDASIRSITTHGHLNPDGTGNVKMAINCG